MADVNGSSGNRSPEIDNVCKTLRILRSTFYRYVRL